MQPATKKKLTFFCIGIFFFLGGVEYAVILPTANLYLTSEFDSKPYMLGLMLSAFCLSGLITSPVMGRWSDRTGHTKFILLFANAWEIAGNIMYILKISDWFLVASRFVAGVGTGIGSALFADIARVTTSEERTATMSTFMAIRQFGLIVGPGFNLFLRKLNFPIGSLEINKYTAPGAFMAVLWLLYEILVLLCFWNLPKLKRQAQEEAIRREVDYVYHRPQLRSDSMMPTYQTSQTSSPAPVAPTSTASSQAHNGHATQLLLTADMLTSSNEIIETAERLMSSSYEDSTCQTPDQWGSLYDLGTFDPDHFGHDEEEETQLVQRSRSSRSNTPLSLGEYVSYGAMLKSLPHTDNINTAYPPSSKSWHYYYDEYCREEIIVLLATVFIALFDQLALETMVTPLTATLLNWEEFENSLFYCGAGLYIIVVFVIIRCASRCLQDRTLLLFGFIMATSVNIYLLWYLPNAAPYSAAHKYRNLPFLMVGVLLNLTGLPFLLVASVSLYSKLTREETQGFSQGLRRMSGGMGNLMGPLWAGALIHQPYIMMGVMVAVMVVGSGMLILSYKKLSVTQVALWNEQLSVNTDRKDLSSDSETDPLLPSTA